MAYSLNGNIPAIPGMSGANVSATARNKEVQRAERMGVIKSASQYCGQLSVGAVYDRPFFLESTEYGRS